MVLLNIISRNRTLTLGLLYAQQYPENVLGLILRGIFLARQRDFNWFYKDGGVTRIFPQQWNAFMQLVPKNQDPIKFYYKALINNDRMATLAWATLNSCIVSYGEFPAPTEVSDAAKIEAHYLINHKLEIIL
jgi:proline iminopeptidase